ncbi:GntR family transcriptional regulator [Desulfopila sp. IMCC35008]|uniref:GntR family transcriptional regulator n=1 Tax=Desulfopila sp. IMCC35008 TaxID=2653858 RepID=UPI0013D3EB1B|nr:GntR family transcriptional regulator [Desulfopila sp. IMCC35008]
MVIVKRTYKDQVVEYLYNLILEGTLTAGDQVKESSLSTEMGISRAPIREGLKDLISNGIIEYRPQVGNFITQLSPKEIVDAYITRGVLEGYAIGTTHDQFNEEEIDELSGMARMMEKYARKDNRKMVVQVGDDFHSLLISKNNNIQLIEYTQRLSLKLHILFYKHWSKLYSQEEIGNRHQRIVDALTSGDAFRVENVIREHYTETGTKIAALQKG